MAWKRHISWTVFLSILVAIGYAVHLLLPPPTRWHLKGAVTILGITADSRQFWTLAMDPSSTNPLGGQRGPLQLRDFATGAVVAEYLASEPDLVGCSVSPSGRFVVGYDNDANCLHLIDRDSETERIVPLPETVKQRLDNNVPRGSRRVEKFALFSPNEAYLRFTEGYVHVGVWSCLIETSTCKIKRRFDKGEKLVGFLLDGYGLLQGANYKHGLWNIEKDQEETQRLGADGFRIYTAVRSPDFRHLITYSTYKDDRSRGAAVWDLATWQMHVVRDFHDLSFSPGGRWLIHVEHVRGDRDDGGMAPEKLQRFAFLNVASGERLGGFQIDGPFAHHPFGKYSVDESMMLVQTNSPDGKVKLDMMQLPEAKRLWTKALDPSAPLRTAAITADSSVMVAFQNSIEIWDGQTGDKQSTIGEPNRLGTFAWHPGLSKDRSLVHAIGFKQAPAGWWDDWGANYTPWLFPSVMILVADTRTGERLFDIALDSPDANYMLSDDGRTLVNSRADTENRWVLDHRAYDIPARPRWAWVVGVPAGLGGLVLGWRRWRQRKKVAAATTM